jgi:hypothetical protein
VSASQAERVLALATERGPLGVTQHDFNYPARDRGRAIDDVAGVIARAGLDLHVVHGIDGPAWMLEAFLPDEFMRSGWGCLACGARHASDWPRDVCGRCEGGPLIRARILTNRDTKEPQPA